MLKIHEIREIIQLIDQSSIQEFKLKHEGTKISIMKSSPMGSAPVVREETTVAEEPAAALAAEAHVSVPQPTSIPVAKAETLPVAMPKKEVQNETDLHKIVSPMVGTFYSSPEPGAAPFVQVGSKIRPDSVICIVEAMKLFNEIEAEVSGEIVKVLVQEGQLVEYGQPLFLVKPE